MRVLFTDRYPALSETFVAAEAPLFDVVEGMDGWAGETTGARLRAVAALAGRHPVGVARDLAARRRWQAQEDVPPLRYLAPAARRWRDARHVHVHFAAGAALAALRLHRITGVPYSVTAHGYDIFQRPANLDEKLAHAAFVTSGSDYTVARLPGHVEKVVMGVDCERFRRQSPYPGGLTVVAVGRLVAKKGFDVLVDAAAALDRAEVLIVGEGPERAALEDRIAARGAPVRLLGARGHDEVRGLLERADVLCAPSVIAADGDRDSMPVVIKEALAMAIPVVVSDAAGLPEAVRPAFGTVVAAGDPDALAAALTAELDRPATERAARGQAGRAFVCEHCSVAGQLAAMRELLDRVALVREEARRRILETVADDARVLDVGGWAVPFPRADWVLDLGAYDTRGEWGYDGDRAAERFDEATWVQRDICDREPWPFAGDQFDFAVCSHTLEDVRDPVWVCSELSRVAKAGYVECPSRLQEQSWGVQGELAGWSHHHWLVEAGGGGLEFLFKHHLVHTPGYHLPAFPDGAEPTVHLWWEGALPARERISLDPYVVDADLRDFVTPYLPPSTDRRRGWRGGRRGGSSSPGSPSS